MRVCVLGAGVIGVTTAYYLSRDGHDVEVIDMNDAAGMAASYANGGQLSYSYVTPLAGPAVLRQLPGLLMRRDAALRFSPSLDPEQWRWCLAFLNQCTAAKSRRTTAELLALGSFSREMWHRLVNDESLSFDYRKSGKLVVYRDSRAFVHARESMLHQATLGSVQQAWTPEHCAAEEPALAPLEAQLAGGIYTASEDAGDCHRFTRDLAALIEQKYGVKFRCGIAVDKLRVEDGKIVCASTRQGDVTADAFVIALGNGSKKLLAPLGIDLPIYPLKGYSLTLPIDNAQAAPSISITDLHHKVVYARLGNTLRVAGMVDITAPGNSGDARRLALLTRQARDTFPNAGDYAQAREWTGARPATPDSKPLLGSTRYTNLWLNTGHGALGFTLACASGRLLSDAIAGRKTALSLAPFSLGAQRSAGAGCVVD